MKPRVTHRTPKRVYSSEFLTGKRLKRKSIKERNQKSYRFRTKIKSKQDPKNLKAMVNRNVAASKTSKILKQAKEFNKGTACNLAPVPRISRPVVGFGIFGNGAKSRTVKYPKALTSKRVSEETKKDIEAIRQALPTSSFSSNDSPPLVQPNKHGLNRGQIKSTRQKHKMDEELSGDEMDIEDESDESSLASSIENYHKMKAQNKKPKTDYRNVPAPAFQKFSHKPFNSPQRPEHFDERTRQNFRNSPELIRREGRPRIENKIIMNHNKSGVSHPAEKGEESNVEDEQITFDSGIFKRQLAAKRQNEKNQAEKYDLRCHEKITLNTVKTRNSSTSSQSSSEGSCREVVDTLQLKEIFESKLPKMKASFSRTYPVLANCTATVVATRLRTKVEIRGNKWSTVEACEKELREIQVEMKLQNSFSSW